jgi:hypothetical protein
VLSLRERLGLIAKAKQALLDPEAFSRLEPAGPESHSNVRKIVLNGKSLVVKFLGSTSNYGKVHDYLKPGQSSELANYQGADYQAYLRVYQAYDKALQKKTITPPTKYVLELIEPVGVFRIYPGGRGRKSETPNRVYMLMEHAGDFRVPYFARKLAREAYDEFEAHMNEVTAGMFSRGQLTRSYLPQIELERIMITGFDYNEHGEPVRVHFAVPHDTF